MTKIIIFVVSQNDNSVFSPKETEKARVPSNRLRLI